MGLRAELFNRSEPYRIMFLLAILAAVLGVGIWPLFQIGFVDFYPRDVHMGALIFACFFSFVAGFFMTAIPRMTGSAKAGYFEIALIVGMVLGQLVLLFVNESSMQINLYFIQLLFLLLFLARRILSVKRIPFAGFYYIPFSFFWSLLGIFLLKVGYFQNLSEVTPLLVDAFLLNLICGLGSRLLPVIARLPNALSPHVSSESQKSGLVYLISALFLNMSFLVYLLGEKYFANFLIGMYLVYHSVIMFSIFDKPLQKSVVHQGFKFAVFSMIGSKLLLSIPHFSFIALNHVFYIGGLLLLTVLVGTRVVLAHGSQSLEYELTSSRLKIVLWGLLLAGGFRWMGGVNLHSWSFILAELFFFASVLLWGHKVILIILQQGDENRSR